eukprot:jgi/Tetstr1/447821/TSEL_035151.t1
MVLRFDNRTWTANARSCGAQRADISQHCAKIEQGILEGIASKDAVAILRVARGVHNAVSGARCQRGPQVQAGSVSTTLQQRILDMREVYVKGMRAAERMVNLRRGFIELLYNRTCQSLYEKDKLPLALNMTLRLMKLRKQITGAEVAMLIHGTLKGVSMENSEGEGANPRIGDRTRSTRTTRMLQVMAEQRTESELAQFSDDDSSGSDWESDGEGSVWSFEGNLT